MNSFAANSRFLFLAALCAAPLAWSGEAVAQKLALIAKGASSYIIVVPDGEDPQNRVQRAALLLQATLQEATGVQLRICKENEKPADKHCLYLGKTRAAKAANLPVDTLAKWNFLKRAVDQDVFLVGVDEPAKVKERSGYLGTYKAAISFLEDEVGVRFLLPGPHGTYVPKMAELLVAAPLPPEACPKIDYNCGRYLPDPCGTALNQFEPQTFCPTGGSNYYWAAPKDKYAKTHPEYFIEVNGVRDPSENHLCVSNPDVQQLMIKQIEDFFDKGYDEFEWYQTDGHRACECAKCVAVHPEAGERLWIVHRKIAEAVAKSRPGKRLVIKAYGPTLYPPKTFTTFPENVRIELLVYSQEYYGLWRKFSPEPAGSWVYNWGYFHEMGFAPKVTPRFVGNQMKFFIANRVTGIYKCGFGECPGLEGPGYYVWGKTAQHPEADPEDLADDFYRAAYGQARVPMKAFFDEMYKRLELVCFARSPAGSYAGRGGRREDYMNLSPEDCISYVFPARVTVFMDEQLKRALALDPDPHVQARLRLVKREFEYVKNIAAVFTCYHAYRLAPNPTTFDLLAGEIDKRNALIGSWYDANGKMIVEDGWPKFFDDVDKDMLLRGGKNSARLSAPFGWNVKILRDKKVLPGAGKKVIRVQRLGEPLALDGACDKPAWEKLQAEKFEEISMGELKEPTAFRVAYDKEAIYFAFDCTLKDAGQYTFEAKGPDGNAWREECLEIFLDPTGMRDKFYHFIFNPIPNSYYDERMGFITDTLHPFYNLGDPTWNGKWTYAIKVDAAKSRWTAEVRIPFETLGVPAPVPGSIWSMNLGREHYPLMRKPDGALVPSPAAEFSLWSPNLEEESFCAPHAFGDVVFE